MPRAPAGGLLSTFPDDAVARDGVLSGVEADSNPGGSLAKVPGDKEVGGALAKVQAQPNNGNWLWGLGSN